MHLNKVVLLTFFYVIILIIQLNIVDAIYFYSGWDVQVIRENFIYLSNNNFSVVSNTEYFSIYPNNLYLTYTFSYISTR